MSPDRLQRAADHTEDANKVSGREDSGLDISVQGVEAVKVQIGKIFVNIEKIDYIQRTITITKLILINSSVENILQVMIFPWSIFYIPKIIFKINKF